MCAWFRENLEIFMKLKGKNTGHIFFRRQITYKPSAILSGVILDSE